MKTCLPMSRAVLVLMLAALASHGASPVHAVQNAGSSDSEADAAYRRRDWPAAEKLYSALSRQSPDNARYWYRLAVCERAGERFEAALGNFRKAGELGAGKGLQKFVVDYELASTYAGMGDSSNALKFLKDSADAGFPQASRLENDEEWTALRTDPQFLALAKEVKHNASPCEDQEFSQFDFWVGDWD